MSHIIPEPTMSTFEEWTADFSVAYTDEYLFPAHEGEDWREWTMRLFTLQSFNDTLIPQPFGFSRWQDWVAALIVAVPDA